MRYPGNEVTIEDTRSKKGEHGTSDKCFYCTAKVGKPHDENCIVPERPVKIRLTMDLIVPFPISWCEHAIDHMLHDDEFCMIDFMGDIERHLEAGLCLCDFTKTEYLREATIEDAIDTGLVPDGEEDETAHLSDKELEEIKSLEKLMNKPN